MPIDVVRLVNNKKQSWGNQGWRAQRLERR